MLNPKAFTLVSNVRNGSNLMFSTWLSNCMTRVNDNLNEAVYTHTHARRRIYASTHWSTLDGGITNAFHSLFYYFPLYEQIYPVKAGTFVSERI